MGLLIFFVFIYPNFCIISYKVVPMFKIGSDG